MMRSFLSDEASCRYLELPHLNCPPLFGLLVFLNENLPQRARRACLCHELQPNTESFRRYETNSPTSKSLVHLERISSRWRRYKQACHHLFAISHSSIVILNTSKILIFHLRYALPPSYQKSSSGSNSRWVSNALIYAHV